jgi:Tol biopolymer transport system component
MGTRGSDVKWARQGEWEPDLDIENQIQPSIAPTSPYGSLADDSPAQSDLRAELKRSGFRICYQSRRDTNSELYVMNADGTNVQNVTRSPSIDEVYPHISRDDQRLCFTVVRSEKLPGGKIVPRFAIYWSDVNGSGRKLVASDAVDPCWDAEGRRIAYVKRLGPEKTIDYQNAGLFAYDIITDKGEELTGGRLYHAYVPCWSPVGPWIVTTVHQHAEFGHAIIAIDLRDGRLYSLAEGGISGCRPDLSWDGKNILWNANDIQIGVAPFRPTNADRVPLRAIAQAPPPSGSLYFGDWSPDGKYIAYAMNPNIAFRDPKTRGLWDIYVVRAEGGPYVQLTFDHANNKQPEFFSSPDI